MRRLAVALLAAVLVGAGCSSDDAISVQARFSDIGDLAEMAPVHYADIRVGEVTDIRLSGAEALVSMSIDREANVPSDITARIRRTSVLGERIIDLVPDANVTAESPALKDGTTIADTEVRPDLENFVVEGSEIFGVISASEIATMVDEGAKGFGDRGEKLATILTNFRDITGAYKGRTADIEELVKSLDRFNSTMAAEAGAHRNAVQNTSRAIEVLAQESDRLERALASLARLAHGSRGILEAHSDEMDRFFDQMNVIVGTLADQQRSLALLLKHAPGHARNTQLVEYDEFNQVIQEFVICGMNDNPKDLARRCRGSH
jgi:phospholipid/cholesterol/gamma-HCH transport system substrate-binding protein